MKIIFLFLLCFRKIEALKWIALVQQQHQHDDQSESAVRFFR